MRIRKRDIGRLFVVMFDDHAQGTGHTVYTEAAGWLLRADRKQIILRPWRTPHDELSNGATDDYAILRSTIESIERK